MFSFRFTIFARIFIFLQLFHYTFSNVFTAVSKMEILAKTEVKMVANLEKYVLKAKEDSQEVPLELERFLSEVKRKVMISSQEHYVENPINAFHLVQRLYYKWGKIPDLIFCAQCPETDASTDYNISMEIITKKNQFYAGEDDVKGAAVALVRLWHTYTLDIDKLIKGQILDTKTDPLTPFDILYVAGVVEEKGQTYDAIVWLHALLKAIEERNIEEEGDVKEVTIVRRLAAAYSSHGMPWESVKLLEEYLRKDQTHKGVARDITYFNSKLRAIPEDQRTKRLQPPSLEDQKRIYEALCRGEGKRSQRILSSLKCFSRQTKIPIYRVKEEVLNYAPRVSLFYEVIFDSERKYLKEAAMNLLARSYIMGDDGKGALADMRVSQTAWLPESSHPIVDRLGRRIELITGLSTRQYPHASHSEDFQVLNYGIGGMYEPHPDWFGTLLANGAYRYGDPPNLRASGDRLATWLYYLEDVKLGGATVFVNLNVTVPVVKGAAAFWYNLKRNGELDENTWHAGCPVLLGSKWVSNKWIRETGQFFRRLCGKNPDSLDGPL